MAKTRVTYTPTRAPRGHVIHAVSRYASGKTACGRVMLRWVVPAEGHLDCRDCMLALHRASVQE